MTGYATATPAATRTMTFRPNTNPYSTTAGTLRITTDRVETEYAVVEFPTGHVGRGFVLGRHGSGECYTVVCGPQGDSCDCPAAVYRRDNGPCKHAAACRKLIDLGKL